MPYFPRFNRQLREKKPTTFLRAAKPPNIWPKKIDAGLPRESRAAHTPQAKLFFVTFTEHMWVLLVPMAVCVP